MKLALGKRNKYVIEDGFCKLIIFDGDGNIKQEAIVDIDDVEKLKQYSFRVHNKGYISTSIKGKTKYLHQIVFGDVEDGYEIDHINRNKLDNRKNNLRQCKHIDNTHNRITNNRYGKQGIKKMKRNLKKPYLSSITCNGKFIFLGYYETLEEAIKVRQEAEKKIYKEYAIN